MGNFAITLLVLSALSTLTALWFLAASIYPLRFDHLAPEIKLLDYAEGLIQDESAMHKAGDSSFDALDTLKRTLARQYAVATTNNEMRNKRRELLRSIAGLATVISVLITLLLVGTTFMYYVPHKREERGYGSSRAASTPSELQCAARAATNPADAGRH